MRPLILFRETIHLWYTKLKGLIPSKEDIYLWYIKLLAFFWKRRLEIVLAQENKSTNGLIFGTFLSVLKIHGKRISNTYLRMIGTTQGEPWYAPITIGACIAEEIYRKENLYAKIPTIITANDKSTGILTY